MREFAKFKKHQSHEIIYVNKDSVVAVEYGNSAYSEIICNNGFVFMVDEPGHTVLDKIRAEGSDV